MEQNITRDKIQNDNHVILSSLSYYLNTAPDLINEDEIMEIVNCGVSLEQAYCMIVASILGLDIVDNIVDIELYKNYFPKMISKLDVKQFYDNPYYKKIRIPCIKISDIELKYEKYKPFESFVCDDIMKTIEGRLIPKIGFFDTEFIYPAILEKGRIWMTITPNEIETMKEPIDKAFGKVLTFGLGLGYYQYLISLKKSVESITVIEINEDIIKIFTEYILPQFENSSKIKLIKADAFQYAENHLSHEKYDFVFTDLWHDVSDGKAMYLRMKQFEFLSPNTKFSYWIEKSILCYL